MINPASMTELESLHAAIAFKDDAMLTAMRNLVANDDTIKRLTATLAERDDTIERVRALPGYYDLNSGAAYAYVAADIRAALEATL